MHEIKLYSIELPVIEQYLYLCFGNKEKFKHFQKNEFPSNDEDVWKIIDWANGVCIRTDDNWIYVWVNDRENVGTMVHELIHAVWGTIENRWLQLEEELFAHIYKYLYTEAEKCRTRKQNMGVIQYNTAE